VHHSAYERFIRGARLEVQQSDFVNFAQLLVKEVCSVVHS
jgi:hypothetical protein